MTGLRAAAVRADVTPPAGGPLAGYGARGDATSQGVHDPLEATLFWLHDEASERDVVWVGLDVVGADEEIAAAVAGSVAAAIGRPDAVVLLCASHTHSSAAAWFARLAPGFDQIGATGTEEAHAARQVLVERIAAAAAGLPESLRPTRLVASEARVHGVGANRHRIDGPHDATAGVLAALDEHGRVRAVVTDYGCHPTVLGHDNLLWSADWPGAARRALSGALTGLTAFPGNDGEDDAAGDPVVLFLQGAAGDASARFVRREQTFAEAGRLGGRYAGQVLDALLSETDGVGGPLGVGRTRLTLPTKRTLPREVTLEREQQARSAWEEVRRTHADGSPPERLARTRHEGAFVDRRLAEAGLPPTLELPLTVVALGGRAWVHLPVELFASFALRIRAASPFSATRVVGYTDGYLGYVADADAHRDGSYEAGVSLFDVDAGEQLCAAAIDLLGETAQRSTPAVPEGAR